jgi:integrase
VKNLTDRFLDSVKATSGRIELRDAKTAGLTFRVSESGAKSWSVLYRRKADGKRRRASIGDYPSFSLADARSEALAIMARVARGEDPAKDVLRGSPCKKPRTFGELADRYLAGHATEKRSGFKDRAMLEKDVLPSLEGELLTEIERADITAILDRIIARGAPIQANRTFEVIRKVFNWGIEKGFIEVSPCYRMKAPAKNRRRDRALSAEEIRRCWRKLILKTKMSWETRMILRLCLVTGQRVGEVAGARKAELRLDQGEWRLPGARVKNGSPHTVPLSPLATCLFKKAMNRSNGSDFVFPSPTTEEPITGHAVAKAMHRSRAVFGLSNSVTPHDLRRTAASFMGELGFSRLIQDKVLNHITTDNSSISGVYDRYSYMREKREALETWANHLIQILRGNRYSVSSERNKSVAA